MRGADAIVLDLEDSVPVQEKASARQLVRDSLPLAARGGAEVLVRVNNDPALLADDIDASVHPGLDGLAIPKAESRRADPRHRAPRSSGSRRAAAFRPDISASRSPSRHRGDFSPWRRSPARATASPP